MAKNALVRSSQGFTTSEALTRFFINPIISTFVAH